MSRLAPLTPGAALALAAVLAVALAGCGSAPLSTSALRTRAARVCRLASARDETIPTPTLPVQARTFLKHGLAVLTPELSALVKLRPGGPAVKVYGTALEAFRRELAVVKDTTESLQRGADPVIAIKTLQRRLEPIEAQENAAWEALEIPACVAA